MTAVTQSSTGEAGAEGKQEVGEMDTACVSQAFVVSGKYFDWMTERHQTSSSWPDDTLLKVRNGLNHI